MAAEHEVGGLNISGKCDGICKDPVVGGSLVHWKKKQQLMCQELGGQEGWWYRRR